MVQVVVRGRSVGTVGPGTDLESLMLFVFDRKSLAAARELGYEVVDGDERCGWLVRRVEAPRHRRAQGARAVG